MSCNDNHDPKLGPRMVSETLADRMRPFRVLGTPFTLLWRWITSFFNTLLGETGWKLAFTLVGAYVGLFSIIEAKHERFMNRASFERAMFLSMASAKPGAFLAAMQRLGDVQNMVIPTDPKLLAPWTWLQEDKPNEKPLQIWTHQFFKRCDKDKASCAYPTDLSGADLHNAYLRLAYLEEALLQETQLQLSNLRVAKLRQARLRRANLQWADLRAADLRETDLHEANLSQANLVGTRLQNANLSHASLREANLSGADLTNADLSRADLSRSNLSRVNLYQADLRGADLTGATLTGVVLDEARLAGVIGLSQEKFDKMWQQQTRSSPTLIP